MSILATFAIYVAAAVAEIAGCFAVEGRLPDRWDAIGAGVCLAGAAIIQFSPRSA